EVPRSFAQRQGIQFVREKSELAIVPTQLQRSRGPGNASANVLPWSHYRMSGIREIVLTNYRSYYEKRFFVVTRSDPSVIRGEKRFLVSCLGCHAGVQGGGPAQAGELLRKLTEFARKGGRPGDLDQRHQKIDGFPPYAALDFRSVLK